MLDFPRRGTRLHEAASPPIANTGQTRERQMNAQENKRIIMEGLQLFQQGDIPRMLNYFHDDAEWIGPDAEAAPFAGSFHGKQEVTRFFSELGTCMQSVRFVVHDIVAENDKVVVIGDSTWLVTSTGRKFDNPWVNVFTMRDGKVIRTQQYYDTQPLDRAFRPDRPDQAAAANALRH
jgi:ketosteroid isomerase-like protein